MRDVVGNPKNENYIKLLIAFLKKHHKRIFVLGLITCIAIAILQAKKVNLGWITAYGADLIVPAMLYYWTRQNRGLFAKLWKGTPPPFFTASLILILCVIWEVRQKYDSTFGTYDNWDLFVYLISMSLCYFFDKKLNKEKVKLPTTAKNNA